MFYIYIDTILAGAQRLNIWKDDSAADRAGGRKVSWVVQHPRLYKRTENQRGCRSALELACPGVQPPRGKRLARYQPRPVYQFVRRL